MSGCLNKTVQCSITQGHDIKSQKQSNCMPGAYINYLVQTILCVFILYSLASLKAKPSKQDKEQKESKAKELSKLNSTEPVE